MLGTGSWLPVAGFRLPIFGRWRRCVVRPFFAVLRTSALAVALSGCVPDDLTDYDWKALQPAPLPTPTLRGRVLVGTANAGATPLTLSIDEGPREGPNVAYVTGATAVTVDARCGDVPMPVEPANGVPAAAARVFLLPDASGAACEIGATTGGQRAAFPVVAVASPTTLQRTGGFYLAWQQPTQPLVGGNALVLRLFDAARQPVNAGAIDLYPYMDMGGGSGHSTPYRAPVRTAPGRFDGQIDFVMSGRWDLTVYLDRAVDAPRLSFRFPGFYVFDP